MNKYEGLFILDPRKADDEGRAVMAELEAFITQAGGSVSSSELMGRKPFARTIKKRKAGTYVSFLFTMPPAAVSSIREKYRLDERVLRMLIVLDERPENYKPEPIVIQ